MRCQQLRCQPSVSTDCLRHVQKEGAVGTGSAQLRTGTNEARTKGESADVGSSGVPGGCVWLHLHWHSHLDQAGPRQ